MTIKNYYIFTIIFLLLAFYSKGFSQSIDSVETKINKIVNSGIILKLNDKGSSYMKFGMGVQLWYRYMEMNPNTIDARTQEPIDYYSDLALRRMRMSVMLNYENRHFIYTQLGLTSEANYDGLHTGMFFHDLWYKARIANNIFIGGGLHMWNGLSRLSNVSYATQLTLDNPGVNFPNVNVSDDFVRQYGVFVHGLYKKVDFSFSINQPIQPTTSSKIYNDLEIIALNSLNIAYNRYHSSFSYKGYVSYSFLETEPVAKTPFKSMTHFGKKGSFLNIGGGFQYVADASGALVDKNSVKHYSQLSFSADLWYEKPLANESVLNIYTAYYNYNFGPNYLKVSSVMGGFATNNPNGEPSAQGWGINQFSVGTGDVFYYSMSYVVPNSLFKSKKKIMPFFAVSYKNFERLKDTSLQYDFGIHYLVLGNNVKLSAQYSTRPVYNSKSLEISENKGLFILQLHAKF